MISNFLFAGTAKVNITPSYGSLINGEFNTRYVTDIYQDIFVRTIILSNSFQQIVFVVVDTCAMRREFLDDVKDAIFCDTGINNGSVLISSTHIHSGGAACSILLGHADEGYRVMLKNKILQSVRLALNQLQPVSIGYGSIEVPDFLLIRRYRMKEHYVSRSPVDGKIDEIKTNPIGDESYIDCSNGQPDTQLSYLIIRDQQHKIKAVLANYNLHYVGDFTPGMIAGDYFAAFEESLLDRVSCTNDFVGVMTNGTSGDVNIWDFLGANSFPEGIGEKSKWIGASLAKKLSENLKEVRWENRVDLNVFYEEIEVSTRKPSLEEYNRSKAIFQQADIGNFRLNAQGLIDLYAREQVLLFDFPDLIQFPIQVFRIGQGIIGALGGEFFSKSGVFLKSIQKEYAYFTICLANDYVGYVPPADDIKMGGYETWRCRTSYLATDAEEKITKALKRLIEKNCTL